ncbi:hypothetical protein ECA1636 [Pectobacterium atrosepticum SCRI1043]|uniref:Uncharacterized protein n=1 Tax=Pectobacterium atrosepticum (strain SCRI 1043 / ATCC BAA-672) TaxID=218491 RepID=Q6D6P6_PECAS|nr:hypothetical protein [Pectobacterium atrosepticum]MCL6409133.1 hypothetical protein [Dickeya dadantii]MCL6316327.1 hypothetical protein [Pectobacterium atrosepticum]MCL6319437.1 hypothetical protein [Pectobacterium atrosepticum]MCL6392977.1 hypothetical protein [Pectobacterium atrosepticum]CAG74540.1 hypothetical protein ECA1636 [Pectobacterium atrosepticum SCRI1043]
MTNKISVVVSMLCEGTQKVKNTIQESLEVFLALSGYSVEEMIGDKNLVDALNRHINNDLVDELGLEYGSVIINVVYNN